MCFHTAQTKSVAALEKRYDAELTKSDARDVYDIPRYHINGFSHPDMLIIPQEGPAALAPALWGIVPGNKKPEQLSDYYKESVKFGGGLNAQSEKLFDHFLYKNSAFTRRCIIPVTGFFEPHEYKGKKYPFHIKQKNDEVLSLAGLYTIVGNVVTFTILTKAASPLFAKIHNKKNRQPVILQKDFEQDWLKDDLNQNGITELINLNFNEENLSTYTVSRDLFSPRVNSDTESIIDEVKYEGVAI
ncbi:SOS response-associated peptidase [Aestuariibaculum sp. M13]|uniref:SOS response-associated peptidase n=1 Tax=Aestuariibaculum sp. M13 TaxID=2967132 RepID=UPI00215A0C44|nr:SOS response-associated peptidase [Aestuariibaculum sp. M13]MCR8666208.1 SOS response-associated peptidase [Aestuariibaculum sp. M13]